MKNIHILPTDKPSRLLLSRRNNLQFLKDNSSLNPSNHFEGTYQNIYITTDSEIKEGDWYLNTEEKNGNMNPFYGKLYKANKSINKVSSDYIHNLKKIILTTDQDLIKDGVQAIDDEFLEWYVKNPSCEEVKVDLVPVNEFGSEITVNGYGFDKFKYKIIIPKEEPKQETLEEAAESYAKPFDNRFWVVATFKDGAKWQQKNSYSEEEVIELLQKALTHKDNGETGNLITAQGEIRTANFYSWFEQNKKK